jgi:carboxyl-terminal processing protease
MFKKRIILIALCIFIAAGLIAGSFFWGAKFGSQVPKNVVVRGVTNLESSTGASIDFGTFWQAWQLIDDRYLNNKNISTQEKVYGAIGGLVASLKDPHTEFFTPEEGKKFQQDVQGNFSGIGAELAIKNNQLVIIAPLKDSPASRAGLQAGDQIVKINATSTDGLGIDKAVSFIRGPENTEVVLTIFRKSWEKPKEIKITRAQIVAPTLDFEMKDGTIAYLRIYSFNANVESLFYQSIVKALTGGVQGIVLDLRNDPGGYLDVAVDLAGWFLPRGTLVVKEAYRDGSSEDYRAQGNAALVDIPIVVIVNQGSASASEILAGTLRDNRKAKIIGEQSFGKGTVQELKDLSDGSSMKLTVAHWVLPNGRVLEGGGLTPDIEVKRTDDDVQNQRDPQLERALQVIKQEINR